MFVLDPLRRIDLPYKTHNVLESRPSSILLYKQFSSLLPSFVVRLSKCTRLNLVAKSKGGAARALDPEKEDGFVSDEDD